MDAPPPLDWRDLALLAISVGARGALSTLAPHLLEGLSSDDAARAGERAASAQLLEVRALFENA